MNRKSHLYANLPVFLALAMTLLSANSSLAQQDELFDVEPASSKPKPVEAPRPIRMEIQDNEVVSQKKSGKFSLFKHAAESKKKIASNDDDIVKDVPEEDGGGGYSKTKAASKSAAGVMCGLIVGVPVRAAKTMASETKRMNSQITSDLTWSGKPDMTAKVFGAALSVPYGIATGLVTGLVKGGERAVHTGGRKPLSKESMSISDPEFR
jgi:hypothetical protein